MNDRAVRIEPLSDERAVLLVNGIYEQMAGNVPPRIEGRSGMLWQCRRATDIDARNRRQETILEKTVAVLAENGHMPWWYNQCPVASGIADSYADRRRAVDLVHLSSDAARLIELKWANNTPVHALFQILEYGIAYVFARIHVDELHLEKRHLMHVEKIGLEVVGPRKFFVNEKRLDLFDRMDKAIGKFAAEKTGGTLSMSLHALSFPAEFDRIPFKDGREVKKNCRNSKLSTEGAKVRDAFSRLVPVG